MLKIKRLKILVALSIAQVVEADAEGEHNHPSKNVVVSAEQKEAFGLVKSHKVVM